MQIRELNSAKGIKSSPWLQLRRSILRGIFRQVFHILCHIEINGKENIPKNQAYIIAHNHISLFEPPLVLAFWPEIPEAIAGADVFDRPYQKFFVRAYHAIPVHRGEYDRRVIDDMLEVLANGKPLVIAPEGGRTHETSLRRAQSGIAYIVDQARVPVLPVGIFGTTGDMLKRALRGQRPKLVMNIGPPILLPPVKGRGKERRDSRQSNSDQVMEKIAELIPESYRGVYK